MAGRSAKHDSNFSFMWRMQLVSRRLVRRPGSRVSSRAMFPKIPPHKVRGCGSIINIDIEMALSSTVRRVVTFLVLLMAGTEIFACQLISPDSCLFSTHANSDADQGCSGDGC